MTDTTPKPLSPAAQAVIDAWQRIKRSRLRLHGIEQPGARLQGRSAPRSSPSPLSWRGLMPDHRRRLWLHILEDLGPPEGRMLPAWLAVVFCLLFPLDGLRSILGAQSEMDFLHCTRTIHTWPGRDCDS